jgi:hypothetical protein
MRQCNLRASACSRERCGIGHWSNLAFRSWREHRTAARLANVCATAVVFALSAQTIGCGDNGAAQRQQAEVRSLLRVIVQRGHSQEFAQICRDELAPTLSELDTLVGGNCARDLAVEWREGIQLTTVGPSTRVFINGRKAWIYDGATPDSAVRAHGRWKLSELPRNSRHAVAGEACEAANSVDVSSYSSSVLPLNVEAELDCQGTSSPRTKHR